MAQSSVQKKHIHRDANNPCTEWNETGEPKLKASKSRGKTPRLEHTTDVSPISSSLGINTMCPHRHSYMKATHPIMFIRFPYRPSLMSYLREVKGEPVDTMASTYTMGEMCKVYASFQNHWNPAIDIPVLSIVGTCGTNVSPPILTRRTFEYATITVMASTARMQEIYEFKVPLIQQILTCSHRIVLQTISAIDVADQLTVFAIHPQNLKEPLALVKIWNLSSYGCQTLHLKGLYEVPRAKVTDELHLLGLSGERDTTYQIQLPHITTPTLSLLEELDLQALGYRQRAQNKPLFPVPVDDQGPVDTTDHNLIARMVPQRATYRHALSRKHVVVPKRSIYYKGGIPKQHKPCFYPPPIQHQPGFPFGTIKPILFPAGFHTYKNLIADKLLTVKDIINDMSADNKNARNGLELFAERFGVSPTLTEEYINHTFEYFYKAQISRMPEKPVPYFVRPATHDLVPSEWIHSTKHPAVSSIQNKVSIINEGEDFPFRSITTDNDDNSINDIDIDLIPDDFIDTTFWFPAEDTKDTTKTKATVHADPEPSTSGTQNQSKVIDDDQSFIASVVNKSMAKYIDAAPFVPQAQRATRSQTIIKDLVRSPPPGYPSVQADKTPPKISDPMLSSGGPLNTPEFSSPVEFLDEHLSPLSPCFCPSSQPQTSTSQEATTRNDAMPTSTTTTITSAFKPHKTTITFGSFPELQETKKINAVISASDTELVDSIKMILARHGITGTFP